MILTTKQEQGLKIAVERYRNKEPYTCISGYAGSGKSTLIQFIISALNILPEDVAYIAYTGKAAEVLRMKGCPNAMTAHKLLYHSKEREDGTYYHIPVKYIYPYKLIVVDEISMLPREMWELLLSHKRPVIALGDPGQLPPVAALANGVLDNPHIFLDEIMRQAAESEIIRLTMDIRDGKPLKLFSGQEVRIVNREEIMAPGFYQWADQIIVGKNNTRTQINQVMRKMLYDKNPDELPSKGEKIICLKNNWNCINSSDDVLVNGLIGTVEKSTFNYQNPFLDLTTIIDFKPDYSQSSTFHGLECDTNIFLGKEPLVNKDTASRIPTMFRPNQFDYGYAITCHKAQGSEYNKVIVLEEYMRGETKDGHQRWLYTAATRAAKKLIIVKNY